MDCTLKPGRVNTTELTVCKGLCLSACYSLSAEASTVHISRHEQRAAGLMPVKSEHQQAKFLPEQLKWL